MSINTAHANGGVLIHSGEYILLHNKKTCIMFSEQNSPVFQGNKHGHIYLTSHRLIFTSKRQSEMLQSFSAPFIAMIDVELQKPDNYIKGAVRAQPNGNYTGEVKFSLHFKSGGAVEYAKALQCAAAVARDKWPRRCVYPDTLPSYTPSRAWYEAPEAIYKTPKEYYNWLPISDEFTSPTPSSVFMTDNPAPYPGIGKMKHCRKSDPFKEPSHTGKCPTPKHSFDGFGQPPKYGVFYSSRQDGVFPHQAAYPPFNQTPDCEPYDLSDPFIDMYEDGYSNYSDQLDATAPVRFMQEDEYSQYVEKVDITDRTDKYEDQVDTSKQTELVDEDRHSYYAEQINTTMKTESIHEDQYSNYPDKIDTIVQPEFMHGDGELTLADKDVTDAPLDDHLDRYPDQVDTTVRSESMPGDGYLNSAGKGDGNAPPEDLHLNDPAQVDINVHSESRHDGDGYLNSENKADTIENPKDSNYPDAAEFMYEEYEDEFEFIYEDVYSNYAEKDNITTLHEDQLLNHPDEVETFALTEFVHEDGYSNNPERDDTTAPPEDSNYPDKGDTTVRIEEIDE